MWKWFYFLCFAIAFWPSPAQAQENTPKMVYLAFEWKDDRPSLKHFEIVPGLLKQGRTRILPGPYLHCAMRNGAKKLVYEANLPTPDRWISEVPDDHWQMRRVDLPNSPSDFFLRVPYQPGAHTIEVTAMAPAENGRTYRKKQLISLLIDFDEKRGGNDAQ